MQAFLEATVHTISFAADIAKKKKNRKLCFNFMLTALVQTICFPWLLLILDELLEIILRLAKQHIRSENTHDAPSLPFTHPVHLY